YHIASEPLAPGRGGPPLPAHQSTNINNLQENNKDNIYNTNHRLIYYHTRCQPTHTPQRELVDIIKPHHDPTTPVSYKKKTPHHTKTKKSYFVLCV
ncbi:hypothetical protein ACVGWX_01000, partial [Enterobacter hormaechei]